jgi:hypothetical protein
MITKKDRMSFVKKMIANNDQWTIRAIEVIYKNQTEDEKITENTTHKNGIGFNGTDANILCSFAKQIERWKQNKNNFRSPLSPKQMKIAKHKMPKYAKQIINVSDLSKLDKIIKNNP